jgi:hypothetical protein
MRIIYRYLSSFCLATTLVLTVASAGCTGQVRIRDEDHDDWHRCMMRITSTGGTWEKGMKNIVITRSSTATSSTTIGTGGTALRIPTGISRLR